MPTNDSYQSDALTQVPSEPELTVVVEIDNGCVENAIANSPLRFVLVEWEEYSVPPPDVEDLLEVDGRSVLVTELSLTPGDKIETRVANALKAAGVEAPGFSVAVAESGATSEQLQIGVYGVGLLDSARSRPRGTEDFPIPASVISGRIGPTHPFCLRREVKEDAIPVPGRGQPLPGALFASAARPPSDCSPIPPRG
jgi:hypothetical protein